MIKINRMAQFMIDALDARGVKYEIVQILWVKHLLKQRTGTRNWVKFTVGDREFCYTGGALLRQGEYQGERIWHNINHAAAMLCADKYQLKVHLEGAGFNVPRGKFFRRRSIEKAYDCFNQFSGKICVKPNHGSQGNKVFTEIEDEPYFRFAVDSVAENYKNIVIEESVEGRHFRFFYIYPEVIGVREGVRMHVKGDGEHSIEELISKVNEEREARDLHTHPPFKVNDAVKRYLTAQNLTMNSIPSRDAVIYLSGASNSTAGAATTLHDLNRVHPSYLQLVVDACKSVPGLYFSGADLVIQDLTAPASPSNHWFLELNTIPATNAFYYPWEGEKVDIASHLLDFLEHEYVQMQA